MFQITPETPGKVIKKQMTRQHSLVIRMVIVMVIFKSNPRSFSLQAMDGTQGCSYRTCGLNDYLFVSHFQGRKPVSASNDTDLSKLGCLVRSIAAMKLTRGLDLYGTIAYPKYMGD